MVFEQLKQEFSEMHNQARKRINVRKNEVKALEEKNAILKSKIEKMQYKDVSGSSL